MKDAGQVYTDIEKRLAEMRAYGSTANFETGVHGLHSAVNCGDAERVAYLLDAGDNIEIRDSDGRTPLLLAVFHDHADVVALLIARGADVNAKDHGGFAPLHSHALHFGSIRVAEMLLDAGARIDEVGGDGDTALFNAAATGNSDLALLLIGRGANAAIAGENGLAPIQMAERNAEYETAELMRSSTEAAALQRMMNKDRSAATQCQSQAGNARRSPHV